MIASVSGRVRALGLDSAVIEVGGVGLKVSCTPRTLAGLRVGAPADLATSLVVREDSLTLFGFADDDERELFETLQGVAGVGPRLAQGMLAALAPDAIRRALAGGDETTLTTVPGIGKKGAARLVLELKDRIGVVPGGAAPVAGAGEGESWRTAVQAGLLSLGWTVKEAAAGVAAVSSTAEATIAAGGEPEVAALLRQALRAMVRA